jgi:hypothetical protein
MNLMTKVPWNQVPSSKVYSNKTHKTKKIAVTLIIYTQNSISLKLYNINKTFHLHIFSSKKQVNSLCTPLFSLDNNSKNLYSYVELIIKGII